MDADILHALDYFNWRWWQDEGVIMYVGFDRTGNRLIEVAVLDSAAGPHRHSRNAGASPVHEAGSMKTKRGLTAEDALAIAEDDATVWHGPVDATDRLEIQAAVRLVASAQHLLDEAVLKARRNGEIWHVIGSALGVTAEAARKKYSGRV